MYNWFNCIQLFQNWNVYTKNTNYIQSYIKYTCHKTLTSSAQIISDLVGTKQTESIPKRKQKYSNVVKQTPTETKLYTALTVLLFERKWKRTCKCKQKTFSLNLDSGFASKFFLNPNVWKPKLFRINPMFKSRYLFSDVV